MKSKKRFSIVLVLFSMSLSIAAPNCFAYSLALRLSRNLHCLFSTQSKFKAPITVTDMAWRKMANILKETGKDSFVFAATSGGCNGFNYELKAIDRDIFVKGLSKGSLEPATIEDGNTSLFIDPMSEMFLLGTTIDFVPKNYAEGNYGSSFVFKPDVNLASSCGCGISFSPKE
jgi:iron-sulfur cluster assembly accessory protein